MKQRYLISLEPFYYGKRLKGLIKVITDTETNTRIYTGYLYTHNKKLVGQRTFFNTTATITEQNQLYLKCHEYVQSYVDTCTY